MEFVGLAFLVSLLGMSPLWLRGKWKTASVIGGLSFLILSFVFYKAVPSLVYPLWGLPGWCFVIVFVFCCGILLFANFEEYGEPEKTDQGVGAVGGVLMLALPCFMSMSSCAVFRAGDYAALIGKPEERVWTQDVQPKDPHHIRMASNENAFYLAKQALGQGGAIGSQFKVVEDLVTPQLINGKFRLVVPIDFQGWLTWRATKRVPGYIVVNGEDPTIPAQLEQLPSDQQFVYTPNACWEYRLDRHLWRNGYANKGLTNYALELDDDHKPWWVVTVFEPKIFTSGEKMLGAVIVNPVTGAHTFYKTEDIPHWVDVAFPAEFAATYIDWHGKYQGGWVNSWSGGDSLTEGELTSMVYGSDGEPYWVTDVTSKSEHDSALVGLYYTHARTGKTTFYSAQGSTQSAVVKAVDQNADVQFKHLHGTVPQLYNVYGTMASVIPLLNDSHIFQEVAIVNVANVQIMGVGRDQFDALRAYQKLLSTSGHQISPELTRSMLVVKGKVDRIAVMPQAGEPTFYIQVENMRHVFTGPLQLSPAKLPLK